MGWTLLWLECFFPSRVHVAQLQSLTTVRRCWVRPWSRRLWATREIKGSESSWGISPAALCLASIFFPHAAWSLKRLWGKHCCLVPENSSESCANGQREQKKCLLCIRCFMFMLVWHRRPLALAGGSVSRGVCSFVLIDGLLECWPFESGQGQFV